MGDTFISVFCTQVTLALLVLFRLITKQIYLLEKYKDFIDTITDTDEYIDEFNKMLSLVALTSSSFDDELDDEVGGKS